MNNVVKDDIAKFFCEKCHQKTRHFIRGKHEKVTGLIQTCCNIIECCGCEHLAFAKITWHPDHVREFGVVEEIYPPVTYRNQPPWFEDLPDETLKAISVEIYKSVQTESHYLTAFGSRTLIDRLIVLTVGEQGSFAQGLAALQDRGMLSPHERSILNPVVDAGNAAAHRAWAPSKDQITTILDTVEGLIHRLLVLPKRTEELEEAVPGRKRNAGFKSRKSVATVSEKIEVAPEELRALYNRLKNNLNALGDDVTVHPQKHYMAFRRNRNFASVQIYNKSRLIRVYLNIDPDTLDINRNDTIRDVRQIGHYGTGDLEVTIKSGKDFEWAHELMTTSYENS